MSKLSYKTLFIIFFFLLIGVVVLSRFVLPKNKVSAAWWNDSWHYRQAISITNSSGSTLTNQRVKVILDTATLVIAGKMQSDCDDIRITDINGNLLDYWTTNRNTSSTSIYIKIPSLATTATTIYVYYGNSSISTGEKTLGTNENPGTSCQMMKDQGSVTTNGTYYIVPGGNDTDKQFVYCDQTTDGGGWTLVMNQKTDTGGFFTNSTQAQSYNESNPTADRYSILGKLSKFKDNGVFTFKLNWPALGSTRNIWSQTSNPISENIVGYSGITIDSSGCGWGGIAPSQDSSATFIDGSPNSGTSSWWFAIASYSYYAPGLPGSCGNATTRQQLWVKGNDTMNNTSTSNHSEEAGGGPVAYWKFDEGVGTTAYDSSSNQNNGILYGSTLPTWQNEDQCIFGKCLNLGGAGAIKLNSPSNANITGDITISAWIKPTAASQGVIIHKENQYTLIMFPDKNVSWADSSNWSYNNFGSHSIGIELNKWSFITVTKTSNIVKIYLNGVQKVSKSFGGSITSTSNIAFIGCYSNASSCTGNYFNGLIDEVKIYPYARTSDQIKLDYNSRGSSKGSSVNLGVKSSTAPSLSSKLIAYYKFDESNGTTAKNSISNNFNGTLSGTTIPTWDNNGKYNKSLNFNGINNYVSIPRSIQDDFSISFWIKTTSTGSGGMWYAGKGLVDGEVSGVQNDFGTSLSGSKLAFGIGNPDTTIYSNSNINNGLWNHITITRNKTTGQIKIFINGKNESIGVGNTNSLTTPTILKIGSLQTGINFFNGLIDEVKIYNTALTDEEIKQDYNGGGTIQFGTTNQTIGGTTTSLEYCIPGDTSYCTPPIAEWKMDEKSGTSVTDIGGNNYHGTLGTGDSSPAWTQGKTGSGLIFDGNDYINFGDSSAGNKLSDLYSATYSFWIYPTALTSPTSSDQRLIEKRDSTISSSIATDGTLSVLFWYYTNPTYTFDSWSSTKKLGYYDSKINEWTTSNLNKWYFVTFVFDSPNNIGKTFINGILDREYSLVNNAGRATGTVNQTLATQFGRYRYGTNNFYQGKVDNIKIYNYARTPAQIAYDYNKGGPVGWWKFDECQGNIAYDWSKNNNNGTINIGTSGTQTSVGTCTDNLSTSAWNNGKTSKINSSLNFDGMDDYISGAGTSSLSNISNGSISFWIYPKDRGTFPGNNQEAKFLLSNSRPLIYGTGGIAIYWNGASNEYPGGVSLPDNIWTHVTVTWQNAGSGTANGNILIYYNGLLKKTMSGLTLPINTGNSFNIGGYTISPFNGQIDDVRIYNYALTSEQVKQVYNGGAINFQ